MSDLNISPDLSFPIETETSTLIVFGAKGMGKTVLGNVLAEELARVEQLFSVLDPIGVWYGLRHGADGISPGIEALILGGVHGDIPIDPTAGSVIADLVADEDVNTIVDISRRPNGSMWTAGEKIRFVADYCSRLFERQGERRRPIHQIIEEAGRYVPQTIPSGAVDIARCVGAIEQLVELGRNVGVGVTLITQRSARINKSVSELADAMIAFRTTGPRSIDAVMDWLGEHVERAKVRAYAEQIRELPVGSALVVSPGWLHFEGVIRVRHRWTFDSSATPDVRGGAREATGPAAKPDLELYRARLAAVIEQAQAKSGDTTELRKLLAAERAKVADLTRQLAERRKPERVEVPVLSGDDWTRLEALAEVYRSTSTESGALGDLLFRALNNLRMEPPPGDGIRAVPPALPAPSAPPARTRQSTKAPAPRRSEPAAPPPPRPIVVTPTDLNRPQIRILEALALFRALGVTTVRRGNVAALADQVNKPAGFEKNLSALRTRGLIMSSSGGGVSITEAGVACVDEPEPILTLDQLHDIWYDNLTQPQEGILRLLIGRYPKPWNRAELAERSGQAATPAGYAKNLSVLKGLGLVAYPSSSQVAATDLVFPEGLE